MNKKAKKALIITSSIVGGIVVLFLLLYAVLAVIGAAMYGEARDIREYVCDIPELNSGFAPQGVSYSAEHGLYVLSGYDGDNIVRLYLTDCKDYRRVRLADENGDILKGHAGGVTCTAKILYVAGSDSLIAYDLNKITAATADDIVAPERVYNVNNGSAFCYSADGKLFVGEFYRAGNYETDMAHAYSTPNGANNRAIASCYALDENGNLVTDPDGQAYPEYAISLPGLVQGFAYADGVAVLSRSYGLKNSTLEYHTLQKADRDLEVTFKNNADAQKRSVPLYYLDDGTRFRSITLPAFSEDITIVNGRVIVTNEASANKYIVGKFFGAGKMYSYPMFEETFE